MSGFALTIGSRAQVMNGTAKKTSGGLEKGDLMYNKAGRIVSKARHDCAKKNNNLGHFKLKKGDCIMDDGRTWTPALGKAEGIPHPKMQTRKRSRSRSRSRSRH